MDPIIINPSDNEFIKRIRLAHGLASGAPLHYRNDDPPSRFEIYRMLRHPEKYTDFSGNLIQSVDNIIPKRAVPLSSNTFVDKIDPNTKYYYTFRAIDIHGNISNPSAIYKIELVDDQGTTYLLLETVELKLTEETQQSKSMKKLFNIVPRMSHAIIDGAPVRDYSSASDSSPPKLGIEENTLWGKKFKIRLISKKSGKKMDLNINFQTEHLPRNKTTN